MINKFGKNNKEKSMNRLNIETLVLISKTVLTKSMLQIQVKKNMSGKKCLNQ